MKRILLILLMCCMTIILLFNILYYKTDKVITKQKLLLEAVEINKRIGGLNQFILKIKELPDSVVIIKN